MRRGVLHVVLLTAVSAVSAVVAGCEHSPPFSAVPDHPTGPFEVGTPERLTYNVGIDERVAWLPDASAFLYTQERQDLPHDERCLALMGAGGGTVAGSVCASLTAAQDSQITFESAAVSSSLKLAYVRAGTINVGFTGFSRNALLLATLATPTDTRLLLRTPFFSPLGRSVTNVSLVQWVGDTSLVVLGELEVWPTCLGCLPDTIRSGLEIDRINFNNDSVHVFTVPGTDSASSVAVGTGDTIYYTVRARSQIYIESLSGGTQVLFRDFGPGVIARDVRVAGSRYVVITGGQVVQTFPDSTYLSPIQRDHGGDLHLVDLAHGTETVLTMANAFARRPVISPDGHRVVFERYPFVVDTIHAGSFTVFDTLVAKTADLWSVQWP